MASLGDQFFYMDAQTDDWVDFDQFLNLPAAYGDDYAASATVSPEMSLPYDAETLGNDLPAFFQSAFPDMVDHGAFEQDQFLADHSPDFELTADTPVFDDAMFNAYQPYENGYSFRQMVETQAAADTRAASIKEKRREAAIALHLQRLCDSTARDLDMSSDSNTSFSSPSWSDYMRESISPQPASSGSPETTPAAPPPSAAGNGGLEMVLDLNMNATTNLPKKQKPRSQAQKENYIKARKYGACEKHKKQHKRCNCLEKAAARAGVNEAPLSTSLREQPHRPLVHVPVLPDLRSSGVPGNDPSMIPRASIKVIKRPTSSSPGHDPSRGICAVLPTVRSTKQAGVPSHDRKYSISGVLPTIRTVRKHTGSATDQNLPYNAAGSMPATAKNVVKQSRTSSGHDPSRPHRSVPQSVKTASESTSSTTWRWRTIGVLPNISALPKGGSNRNTVQTNPSDAGGTFGNPHLQVRRPRHGMPSGLPESSLPASGTRTSPIRSTQSCRNTGFLGIPSSAPNAKMQGTNLPVDVLVALSERSRSERVSVRSPTGSKATSESPVQTITNGTSVSSFTSRFVGSILSIFGLWQSPLLASSASQPEDFIFSCLSFFAKKLRSARGGLQLFNTRSAGL
ncbi:hypothetical protein N7532_004206 [Penicillium argentinense]|uniref:Uncharacterized protein n=1 Tax=Penicillium argentinense TaxID=1131581 RepID=A0A9W9FNX3_9EURO|nr:uncharacterized protein N7532_004206 [Penicillium argentinense]KAJ5103677.1 hypothetical protein N7532_004206 [Penicillium argentinense]